MTDNWIEDSRELLLEQIKSATWVQEQIETDGFFDKWIGTLAPLEDGTVDPGDEDRVVDNMLSVLGDEYIPFLRRYAGIQMELHDTYGRLRDATDDEVHDFARMWLKAYLQSSGALEVLSKLAQSPKEAEEALDSEHEDEPEVTPWAT